MGKLDAKNSMPTATSASWSELTRDAGEVHPDFQGSVTHNAVLFEIHSTTLRLERLEGVQRPLCAVSWI